MLFKRILLVIFVLFLAFVALIAFALLKNKNRIVKAPVPATVLEGTHPSGESVMEDIRLRLEESFE